MLEKRLEEVLEVHADHSRKKLLHTFNSSDPTLKDMDIDDPMVPDSPSFDNSRISRHRSICMENQLELNESENDYYETIIEELVEKLGHMKREKEDLQSICNSLGDRLQRIGKDNEDKLSKLAKSHEEEKQYLKEQLHLSERVSSLFLMFCRLN